MSAPMATTHAPPTHAPTSHASSATPTDHVAFALAHRRPRTAFQGCSRIGDYEMLGKLGEGTFGCVFRARAKRTGDLVALKMIIIHHEKDGFPITALREIRLLKMLQHRNILRLDDMAVEHKARSRPVMYMVTPYMDHDLAGLLENPRVTLTLPQIKCYLLQLLEGVRYLHASNILHRDMKAANLLINNQGILQIADFGLARHYSGGGGGNNRGSSSSHGYGEGLRDYTGLVVTRWYRPPELLLSLKRYTPAIDMWGVGCVFGEMLEGKPILTGESEGQQLELVWDLMGFPTQETMPRWNLLPGAHALVPRKRDGNLANRFKAHGPGAVSLLKELLRLDWRQRITAAEALQHPYFKMDPRPAAPSDLPQFEESHELDRQKFQDEKRHPPPAPEGGAVGRGSEQPGAGPPGGDRNESSSSYYPPNPSYRNGRGGGGGRGGGYRNDFSSRGQDGDGAGPDRRPAWQRVAPGERGLPNRPPVPYDAMAHDGPYLNRGGGGGGGYRNHYRGGRDRDYDRPRDSPGMSSNTGTRRRPRWDDHAGAGGGGGGDSYKPNYPGDHPGTNTGPRPPDRRERSRSPRTRDREIYRR